MFSFLGKLKLDPAKNGPSKAELTKKINQSLTQEPLPPIKGKENDKNNDKNKGAKTNKNTGQAFTVVFDEHSDKLKMKKYSKYHGIPKRDTSSTLIDDRYKNGIFHSWVDCPINMTRHNTI